MKTKSSHILTFVMLLMLALMAGTGCRRETPAAFLRAESLMEEHPDSALAILDSIGPDALLTPRDRALHALLLTQANDKNYRSEKSDSLINIAIEYFKENTDKRYSAMSRYYRACIYYNDNNYIGAINDALNALETAYDPYWQGRIHALMADIYHKSFNHNNAVEHLRQSVACFDKAGNTRFSDFYRIALVNALSANGDTGEAVGLLDSLTSLSEQRDSVTVGLLYSAYIHPLLMQHQPEKALKKFNISREYLGQRVYTNGQLPLIARMYLENGMLDSARFVVNSMKHIKPSYMSDSWYHHVMSLLYTEEGKYKESLDELRASDSISYDRLNSVLKTNISGVADLYHRNLLSRERESLYKTRIWLFISLASAALIIIFVILYHMKNVKLKKARTAELLSSLSDIKTDEEMSREIPENTMIYMETLYKYHIRYLQARNTHDRDELDSVISEFDRLVKDSDTDRFIDSVIDSLNRNHDNMIEKLVGQLPGLNSRYVKAYALIRSGIPVQFCAILMKTSQDNMHTIKSRLLKKIKESGCADKDLFLKTPTHKKTQAYGMAEV